MALTKNFNHENFDRKEKFKSGTEKSFGLTFGCVFLIIALLPLLRQHPANVWPLGVSFLFFVFAFGAPAYLKFPNMLWLKLGLLLNRIVSPVILSVLFFLVFLPTGLLLKLFKKDILGLKLDRAARSYWIRSADPESSMKDQF